MALVAMLLGACGDDSGATLDLPRADEQYDGPLYVDEARYGAAGEVLDCRMRPAAGAFQSAKEYGGGATSDDVALALDTARSEGLFLEVPVLDLAVAKTDRDRVLLTYTSENAVKAALIFHDGPATEGAGGAGWYLESWARCDLAEFPAEVAESFFGYQLWTGPDGLPALTSKVVSFPGSQHCDWQSTTFLALGEGRRDQAMYAKDPQPELVEHMQGPYVDEMELPADAVTTPYSREGQRLWLSPDERYAYVGKPGSVEGWPRTKPGFGCA